MRYIQFDSIRFSFVQKMDSSRLKRYFNQSKNHFDSVSNKNFESLIDKSKRDSIIKRKIVSFGSFFFFFSNRMNR